MFTGLVQGVGSVAEIERSPDGARITIATPLVAELSAGNSIAINGVCLTAVTLRDVSFAADAMNETLARTSLGDLGEGAGVNLELPLRADAADRRARAGVAGSLPSACWRIWAVRSSPGCCCR